MIWTYFSYCYMTVTTQRFYNLLYMAGTAYLLAVPVAICAAFVFAEYHRQMVYEGLSQGLMQLANTMLLYQMSYQKSSWSRGKLDAQGLPTKDKAS